MVLTRMLPIGRRQSYARLYKIIKILYTDSVRASHETHYVSATKPNRLMLFRETVAIYCENHKKHKIHSVGRKLSPCLT
jgi:hypothetical protein